MAAPRGKLSCGAAVVVLLSAALLQCGPSEPAAEEGVGVTASEAEGSATGIPAAATPTHADEGGTAGGATTSTSTSGGTGDGVEKVEATATPPPPGGTGDGAEEIITCTEEPMEGMTGTSREAKVRRTGFLNAVKGRHAAELRAIPGVISLGIGRGGSDSKSDSKLAEDIRIIVGVERGLSAEQRALIPSSIEGCPIVVEEPGHPVERGGPPDTKHRQETPAGIVVSRFPESSDSYGTLTGTAWKEVNGERKWYLVTAFHVLAKDKDPLTNPPPVGREVHQPASPDLVARFTEGVDQSQDYPPADAAICEYEDPWFATAVWSSQQRLSRSVTLPTPG